MREITFRAAQALADDKAFYEVDTSVDVYYRDDEWTESILYLDDKEIVVKTKSTLTLCTHGRVDHTVVDRINGVLVVEEGYVYTNGKSVFYHNSAGSRDITNEPLEVTRGH